MAPVKGKKKGKQPHVRSPSPSPTSFVVTNVVNSKPRLKIHGPKPPATPELSQPESEDPISAPEPGLEPDDLSQSDDSIRITPAPEFKISRKEVKNAVIGLLGPGLYKDEVESLEAEPEEMEVDSPITLTSSDEEKKASAKGPKKRSRKAESEESDDNDEDEDLDEDEDDGMESDEDSVFSVQFSVPFDSANSNLTVQSDISWTEFATHLANTMSLSPKNVRVAYRFSTEPRTAPFSHVASGVQLIELMYKAREAMEQLVKNPRSKKKFVVELKDLSAQGKDKASKGDKGKKSKHAKKKKKTGDSESESGSSGDGNSDDEDSEGRKKKKKKSATQWVAQLWKDNGCVDHPGDSCLKFSTHHYKLTKEDLGTWAIFLARGYKSTTIPPPQLKIGDKKPEPKTPARGAEIPPIPPAGTMPYPPPIPYGYPPHYLSPYGPPMYPHSPSPWGSHVHSPSLPNSSSSRRHYQSEMPSSDPPEELEDVTIFPRLAQWLADLDAGPRGADGHNFAQFAIIFESEKYFRICDIADSAASVEILMAMCIGMARGTASKILAYAQKDVDVIRKKEGKRS